MMRDSARPAVEVLDVGLKEKPLKTAAVRRVWPHWKRRVLGETRLPVLHAPGSPMGKCALCEGGVGGLLTLWQHIMSTGIGTLVGSSRDFVAKCRAKAPFDGLSCGSLAGRARMTGAAIHACNEAPWWGEDCPQNAA